MEPEWRLSESLEATSERERNATQCCASSGSVTVARSGDRNGRSNGRGSGRQSRRDRHVNRKSRETEFERERDHRKTGIRVRGEVGTGYFQRERLVSGSTHGERM